MYALGRDVEHFDMTVVRQIMRDTDGDDYRLSSVVMAVVNSTPFWIK